MRKDRLQQLLNEGLVWVGFCQSLLRRDKDPDVIDHAVVALARLAEQQVELLRLLWEEDGPAGVVRKE